MMKSKLLCIGTIFLVACSANSGHLKTEENQNISEKIGRVQNGNNSCIGSLKPIKNNQIILINFDIDDSGKVKNIGFKKENISSSVEQTCIDKLRASSINNDFKYFYGLKISENHKVINHFILNDNKIILEQNSSIPIALDINLDGKADYFDMCYSSEGIHFNIWDSVNRKRKLFHDYVYLDFDTIDNCSEEDYSDTSD